MINENKIMLYGDTARNAIYEGMKKVFDAVRVTMGPSGRNVIIENEVMKPIATKDGVTVASYVKLSDKKQDMGAQLIKGASRTTSDGSSDGTTTATVLTFSMISDGLETISNDPKINLIDFKRGMDYATGVVLKKLKDSSIECRSRDDIYKVAMISSNGDEEISELVTEAVYKAKIEGSEDGTITVETSTTFESNVEVSDAVVMNSGYGQYFQYVNNNTDFSFRGSEVRVLIFDGSIGAMTKGIERIVTECYKNDETLLIVANEFSNNFHLNIIQNISRGLKCVLVTSPEFGTYQKLVLKDIAVATGTTVFGGEGAGNHILETIESDQLGYAQDIIVQNDKTYIKVGVTKEHIKKMFEADEEKYDELHTERNATLVDSIKEYCDGIRRTMESMKSSYERGQAERRITNLSSIKSTINLYGMTEVEVNEMKQRAEDAVFATTSAIEEGYVLGGGVTLAKISRQMETTLGDLKERNRSFILGYKNIIKSINRPLIQILENAFHNPKNITGVDIDNFDNIIVNLDENSRKGFDVRTLEYVDDMVETGIIDPVKVIRLALQNANSISSVALTTECLIFSDAYYSEELSSKENHKLMYE